jgi:glycerophosphoryl diester phosphodiesterase
MHDTTVDRTTNGTGAVKDLTLAQIKSFDAGTKFGAQWAGTTVPTLEEVLQLCQGKGKIQIELKEHNTDEQIQKMIDLVQKYEMRDKVMFISFHFDNLSSVRKKDAEIEVGLIGANNLAWVTVLSDLDHAYALNSYKVWQANPSWAKTFRQAGVGCGAWTITTPEVAEDMIKIGVKKITSDIPLKVLWTIQ